MENVILITESAISLEKIKTISCFAWRQEGENLLHYGTKDQFLSIIYSAAGAGEYDDEELTEIKSKINTPTFFLLDTNSFDLLKKFIGSLPDNLSFLIDNNFGSIMNKRGFMKFNDPSELFSTQAVKSLL